MTLGSSRPSGEALRRLAWRLLLCALALQAATGALLMTVYSPGTTSAWGSVLAIERDFPAGRLIRGLHHFGSQALIILSASYVALLFVTGRRLGTPARHWRAAVLVPVLLTASCVTGWLLPWDERGYWGVQVPVNLVGLVPLAGERLRSFLLGGDIFGQYTLTRFHAWHVVWLPACILAIVRFAGHRWSRGTNGCSSNSANQTDGGFNAAVVTSVLALYVAFLVAAAWLRPLSPDPSLTAPVDPAARNYPARPEWTFLWLFQWLKMFHGEWGERIGALFIPALGLAALLAWPSLTRRWRPSVSLGTARILTAVFAIAVVFLTYRAIAEDRVGGTAGAPTPFAAENNDRTGDRSVTSAKRSSENAPDSAARPQAKERCPEEIRATRLADQRREAARRAERALFLADRLGIPFEGPLKLLQEDPLSQGPRLFARHCSTCHRYDGHDGLGHIPPEPAAASDLAGFGGSAWIRGFLSNPNASRYFGLILGEGGEPGHTRMAEWRQEQDDLAFTSEDRAALERRLDSAAAFLASQGLRELSDEDLKWVTDEKALRLRETAASAALLQDGRSYFFEECNRCHAYEGQRTGTTRAPEMGGYGGAAWIARMIANPANDELYRATGREKAIMPSFETRLSADERLLIARWLMLTREDFQD